MMKMCMCCGRTRSLFDFYPHRRVCKPCIVDMQRDKRNRHGAEASEVSTLLRRWGRAQIREQG